MNKIKQRYFRNGTICHHGDCLVFSAKMCSCGLLHDLSWRDVKEIEELYPNYFKEDGEQHKACNILDEHRRLDV